MFMSNIIKPDLATEESYRIDGFDPATSTEKYSYTSARVAKPVYNKYNNAGRPKVFGYYTDWSQYDGRLQGSQQPADRGRGVDLALVAPTAFDKLIIGFVASSATSARNPPRSLTAPQPSVCMIRTALSLSLTCGAIRRLSLTTASQAT